MSNTASSAVSIPEALAALTPLVGRTPTSNETGWAAALGHFGNAGIFIADYSGESEWERHTHGDEIVITPQPTDHSTERPIG